MTSGSDSLEDSLLRAIARAPEVEPPVARPSGEVVAGRFTIERLARSGGMGTVYRALDRVSGAPVALKFVTHQKQDADRFAREARVLAELLHPAIVRYVAHGITAHGQAFLAMEWLEGEDLRERLARDGLTVTESIALARRVAEGLAAAHARGIVHRDVKPSNVLLLDGDPARTKLLDFGIVRLQAPSLAPTPRPMTGSGIVLGTVGYMSPEQAMGDRALDARTDVFALGCVLFECLTGRPAFSGAHAVAVLAKVLREEAPRLREVRPELPPALDELVARMLSKNQAARPSDGASFLHELNALGAPDGGAPTVYHRGSRSLFGGEQRLVSVVLAIVPDGVDRAKQIIRRHGGDPVRLANGALLVSVEGGGNTTEQVVTAASWAMELHQAIPSARVAVATGRAQTTDDGASGPVIDHAASLLTLSMSASSRIDEVSAGLLGERFEVREESTGKVLVARRREPEAPRTLLGKPTPCVGRDKELGLLDATLRECIEESVARAVLVTGPPGQGKSRLRYEFITRARARGDVVILTARADPVGAGSAFVLARQLVRQAAGLQEGGAEADRFTKLRDYVTRSCQRSGLDAARISDFLGELVNAPSTERGCPELRAARNDPQIMAVWLRRSFGDWLAAECTARPLLLVLEDLHWGDVPSITYLVDGLRALSARPLMLLALGRPEVHGTFPSLRTVPQIQEVALGRLTPRAAERLVRAALGEATPGEAVARVVDRADGNAFYLEELVRCLAEGGGDTLPETVLALAQSRLERLEPEARRVVRAASVFGEVFWNGAIAALLGESVAESELVWLTTLCEREVLCAVAESRFPGESAYRFRHGLLREAAYAMLTDIDRSTGHRLAGEWLEAAGETDALAMADHFDRGGELQRAAPWLARASESAFDGGNVESASALADRGLACEPDAAARALLLRMRGLVAYVRGDWRRVVESGRDALGLVPKGSTEWFTFISFLLDGAVFVRNRELRATAIQEILSVSAQPEPSGPYGFAVHCLCFGLGAFGHADLARPFLERATTSENSAPEPDPMFVAWVRLGRAWLHLYAEELGSALASAGEARALADRTGASSGQAQARLVRVLTLAQTGDCERTEVEVNDLVTFSEALGFKFYCDWGKYALALAKLNANQGSDAVVLLRELVTRSEPDSSLVGSAWGLLARALVEAGDVESGSREAERMALEFPGRACSASALVAARRHDPAKALALAQRGLEGFREPHVVSILRLLRAEALHALGRMSDACAAIREARDRIVRNAAALDAEPSLRESYLTAIVAHTRTFELATDWLGGD